MADNLLDYYLGPTGIPDRLRHLNELFNPIVALSEAGQDLRRGDYVGALTNTVAAAVPVAGGRVAMKATRGIPSLAPRSYDEATSAVSETLTGVSAPNPADVTKGRAVIRRDDVYRGEGPARVSPTVAKSDAPYALRITGMDQLEDMIASGLVRPKPGGYGKKNMSQLYFGETSNPDPMASIFSRPTPEKPVVLVGRPAELGAYEGGIPIDALERVLLRQESGVLVDILDDILARNQSR